MAQWQKRARALWPLGLTLSLTAPVAAETLLKAPDEGGTRRWEVAVASAPGHAAPDMTSDVVTTFAGGTVLENFGCARAAADNMCTVKDRTSREKVFVALDHLRPASGPDGQIATGKNNSGARARKRDFDDTTTILCAQERGQDLRPCKAAIARAGGGDATLVVTFPNGFERALYFEFGDFSRGSATMSGVGTDMDWQLDDDVYEIRVDDQRFAISRAFVLGLN